ncbi:MAG: glycosyltransferase, partial [Bauldia sp.]
PDTDGEAARMMRLLSVADPTLQAVTAVILAAEEEPAGLRGRLASVFDQSVPVYEIVVLARQLGSRVRVLIETVAAEARREVRIVERSRAHASLADALDAAAATASSDYLWVMPADGRAETGLVSRLSDAFADDAVNAAWALPQRGRGGRSMPTGPRNAAELRDDLLAAGNVPLDLGAVIWRRSALAAALRASPRPAGDLGAIAVAVAGAGNVVVKGDAVSVPPKEGRAGGIGGAGPRPAVPAQR